ncbi:MAG TPA: chemotaxis protein CheW [Candidatus Acidoferrales bacterium]|nr:chemotaxis protein CheW [Candidatus Acidoferrales bacterium]
MTVATDAPAQSFVLLPLGSRRIAFPAESVIELVAPGKVQTFPHGTPWISGVLVRRNRVVPVCDVSQLFGENASAASRFYLIAEWKHHDAHDWCAIPVCGECELASARLETVQAEDSAEHPVFVTGAISGEGEKIKVIDLAKLIQQCGLRSEKPVAELAP